MLLALNTIATNQTQAGGYKPSDPIQSYVSIAIFADSTRIYYDQWENGFDPSISTPTNLYNAATNPGGTQIWGDGDLSNGYPPGYTNDLLMAGKVVLLTNAVVTTSRGNSIYFDGGDKIASTKPIAVTRALWASGSSTLFANADEVYDTAFWGTDFQSPVGTNIPDTVAYQMFEYTGFSIMAGAGGATVRVDANADGVFETNCVLAEGRACLINGGVSVGGRVVSDNPVQVDLMTADVYENFESRFIRLLPTALWSASATTPVSTPMTVTTNGTTYTAGTTVWLYNPQTNSLSISYLWRSAAGLATNTLVVPGGIAGGYLKQVVTNGYGARFISRTEAPFYAIATVDSTGTTLSGTSGGGANRTWDWGFALVPESSLTPQVLVGLGIGRDPTSSTSPNENGSPVWVTPLGNGNTPVTVYVDYDSDPTTGAVVDPNSNRYDVAYSVRELEQLKIYNPSGNQTGMMIYTLTPNVKLAAAWGADPISATVASPGLDMGTGIPPFPLFVAQKKSSLLIDADGDGYVTPGDTLRYGIVIENTGRQPVTDLDVQDILPAGLIYVTNTTVFVNANAATNPIADNALGHFLTAFPLDEGGIPLPDVVLPVRSKWEVAYVTQVAGQGSLPEGTVSLRNTATVGGSGLTTTNSVTTSIRGRIGGRIWWDDNGDGLLSDDEPGVNGVTVELLNADGSTALDDNGLPIAAVSAATDARGGSYLFVGVVAGSYRVRAVAPSGYVLTTRDADGLGLGGAINSDFATSTGLTDVFTLKGGEFNVTVCAGLQALPGSISGAVTLDADGDGVVDPEDTDGLAGASVRLLSQSGDSVASATTSSDGSYTFFGVRPGTYTVELLLPMGYTNTCDAAGANDRRIPASLAAGQALADASFYVARAGVQATATAGKVLYLSDPAQSLDRRDPVATGDQTTATTAELYAPAVTCIGSSSSSANNRTLTFSHTVATGTNRLLLVGIAVRSSSVTVSSVTYGGTALSQYGSATRSGTSGVRMYLYRLLSPASGTANVVVSLSGTVRVAAGASTFINVDQDAPLGTFVSATGSSSSPTVAVPSATGDVVFDTFAVYSSTTATADSGQTKLWENHSQSKLAGGSSTRPGDEGVEMGWSTGSGAWAIGAVPIHPAHGTQTAVTFTQSPAFALPFALQSGATIRITNFVTVTSGSLPANPSVVARLSAGGNTFLTTTNATYSSATGALVCWGNLLSSVVIPAGAPITLSVSNEQFGVGFQIRFDSATSPSKVVLPTSSIIAVPSIGVYNAAYPDGAAIDRSPIGATRYIRVVATDPFGAYDINGVDLVVDGPGTSGDVSVSLGDARVVASNAWSKTYEYVWTASAQAGTYSAAATAHEGTEGVFARAAVSGSLYDASLEGHVFVDYNGNGKRDDGEGISGLSVAVTGDLDGSGQTQRRSVLTGKNGAYAFDGLNASAAGVAYRVSVETNGLPNGVTVNTCDPDGGGDSAAVLVLSVSSPTRSDIDFGYRSTQTYTIQGKVMIDADRNDVVSAPDVPYKSTKIKLYTDPNNDGDPSDGVLVAIVKSGADGSYVFGGLIPGNYVVVASKNTDKETTTLPVSLSGTNSVNNDFVTVIDPAGFFYDTADGRVVPGGSISVLGTNAVILMDGSMGEYMFISTNSAPAVYTVVVTPPPGYVLDPSRAAQAGTFDPTGYTDPVVLGSGLSELNKDYLENWSAVSNVYYLSFSLEANDPRIVNNNIPLLKTASVYGYLFLDRSGDKVHGDGDYPITNALVRLASNGAVLSTNTDATGCYRFDGLLPGAATVLVSNAGSKLCGVPTEEPAASDPERSRAIENGADATIVYDVTAGYGTTAASPGEPFNVGYTESNLSTAMDVKLYTTSGGNVSIEIRTVDEAGYGDIVVYAWIGESWAEVGRVPSSEVVGEGCNVYTALASGLAAGESYYLRIVDEAGHVHDSSAPISVASVNVDSIRLSMQTAYVSFTTTPDCTYVVKVCGELSSNPDDWVVEYVSVSDGSSWSAYSNQPFVAGPGTKTVVRIPVNRQKAFFKIVRTLE